MSSGAGWKLGQLLALMSYNNDLLINFGILVSNKLLTNVEYSFHRLCCHNISKNYITMSSSVDDIGWLGG